MEKFPSFYQPDKVGELFAPRTETAIKAGLTVRDSIGSVDRNTASRWSALIGVDIQPDFVIPDFALPVTGAVEDTRRTVELIYRRPDIFDEVLFTMDQHFRLSIFFSTWWVDQDGNHPDPYTEITVEDFKSKKWIPVIMSEWSAHYLRQAGVLVIWPEHCIIGTEGARIVPAFEEAMWWHSAARNTKPISMIKGTVMESEYFGPFEPNVHIPGHPNGGLNTDALNLLGRYERTFWVGQARDFCVFAALQQYVDYYAGRPEILKRVYLIKDCTSLVFADQKSLNDALLQKLADMGINIVTSDEVLAMPA